MVFVQRFGDALNLHVHFHALVLDGVYDARGEGRPEFHALGPPSDEELAGIAARIARRVARTRRGRGCPRCHGPMRILAAIHPPDTAGAILECLGLPARPPPVAPARGVAPELFESDADWSRD